MARPVILLALLAFVAALLLAPAAAQNEQFGNFRERARKCVTPARLIPARIARRR